MKSVSVAFRVAIFCHRSFQRGRWPCWAPFNSRLAPETCGISHDLWIPKVQDGDPKIAKLPTKKKWLNFMVYGNW